LRYPVSLHELVNELYMRRIPVDPVTRDARLLIVDEGHGVVDVHSLSRRLDRAGNCYCDY
jgi:hypothetical protein